MGEIGDVRKVIQDAVAPDLKAPAVRLDELEKCIDERFRGVEDRFNGVEQRFEDQRAYLDKRFDSLERMLNQQPVINGLLEGVRFLESSVRATPAAHEQRKVERVG